MLTIPPGVLQVYPEGHWNPLIPPLSQRGSHSIVQIAVVFPRVIEPAPVGTFIPGPTSLFAEL